MRIHATASYMSEYEAMFRFEEYSFSFVRSYKDRQIANSGEPLPVV